MHQASVARSPRPTRSLPGALVRWAPVFGLLVVAVSVLSPLSADASLGWFSRYTADDYCTAGAERVFGLLGAQLYWFETWSGRFTYYAVVSVVELAGPALVQVLPLLALAVWLAAGAWALRPIAAAHGWPVPWISAGVVGATLVLVCTQGAPDLEQVLYWQTGMLTYVLPLILLTAFAGWINRLVWRRRMRQPTLRESLLAGAFLFAAAGLSETTLALQLALLVIVTALSVWSVRVLGAKRLAATLPLLVSGLAATLVAAVVLLAAPGNAVHEMSLTGSTKSLTHLPAAVGASVDFVGLFARAVEFRARPAVLLLLAVTLWLGWRSVSLSGGLGLLRASAGGRPGGRRLSASGGGVPQRVVGWHLVGLVVIALSDWLLLIAATTPGYFAQGWDPPERAQIVAVWAAAVGLGLAAYLIGRLLAVLAGRLRGAGAPLGVRLPLGAGAPLASGSPRSLPAVDLAWTLLVLILAVGPLASTQTILRQLPSAAVYAAEWDATDAAIRARAAAGLTVVLDHSLPRHFGFDFVGPDPASYPSPCVAEFYGVAAVEAPAWSAS